MEKGEYMREYTDRFGKSVVLNYPYDSSTRNLEQTWRDTAGLSELSLDQDGRETLDWLLAKSCGIFHVVENSNWHTILKDRIDSVKIKVCSRDEAEKLVLAKKSFLLLDQQEIREGIGHEIFCTFRGYPPTILSIRHICVLKTYFGYISGIAELLAATAGRQGKSFVMPAMSYAECILADLLYALVDQLTAIMKIGTPRLSVDPLEYPFIGNLGLQNIPESTHALFMCNAFGITNHGRKMFLRNKRCDYYFLHGPERTLSNVCLAHKPFIFWAYPYAGTGRIFPVVAEVLNHLGITASENNRPIWNDGNFRENDTDIFRRPSIDVLHSHNDEYIIKNRVVDIYQILPPSSCLFLHWFYYRMADILRETGSMAVVLMRDMRDIISSNIKWRYGGLIKYGGGGASKCHCLKELWKGIIWKSYPVL